MGSPTTSSTTSAGESPSARMTFVYDGHCVLCSAMARHVLARDPGGTIRLVAAQSPEGRALYLRAGLPTGEPTTNLFVERNGRILTHGDSSLRILEEIGYPPVLLRAARLVPRPLRDAAYVLVARSGFRLFGRHETCQLVSRPEAGLYRRLLGAVAFDRLPEPVRALHDGAGRSTTVVGTADVVRGRGVIARLICAAFRLPAAGASVPLTVTVELRGAGERWTRCFAGRAMTSRQALSRDGALVERFGPVLVAVEVVADDVGLVSLPRRTWLAGVPIPVALMPSGRGRESARDGRYRFDVDIGWLGRIVVSYAGDLGCRDAVAG